MKVLAITLVVFCLIPFVSSQELLVEQDEPLDISVPIRANGAVDSTISANVSLKDPLQRVINFGLMTFLDGVDEYNYSFPSSNHSRLGTYEYCITAHNSDLNNTECFNYEVRLIAQKASTSESIVYLFVGFMSLIFFLLSLYGSIKIPFKNTRDGRGRLISINDLKYVKLFLWFVTYLLLVFIVFAFRHVSVVSNWDVASRFLNFMNLFLLSFMLPIFILLMVFAFTNFFADKKNLKLIERNLKPR